MIFALGEFIGAVRNKIKERYKKVCENKSGKISGDGSINYFYTKEVPRRIKTFCPEAKLIVLLRNPIDKLYSNYWMNVNQNIPNWKYKSFNEFIESGAYKAEINLYSISLKRWLNCFKLEDILIIDSTDFFDSTRNVLKKVENYLEINNHNYEKEYFVAPFQTNASNYPELEIKTRNMLVTYFRPYVKELEVITDKRFNWKDFN